MKNYIPTSNGFKNKNSFYEKSYNGEGKLCRIHGIYYINGILMKFYLIPQTKGALFRGQISIISPASGEILQVRGKNRREKFADLKQRNSPVLNRVGRQEAFNATSELYINTYKDEDIKKHIDNAALKLYSKYEPTIRITLKEMGLAAKLTAAAAMTLHYDDFEKDQFGTLKPKTCNAKQCALRRVTAFLSSVPMGEVTPPMINAYARENPKTAKRDLLVARHFWDFCKKKHAYDNENPLDKYFDNIAQCKHSVDPRKAIQKASELTCLPTEAELSLNRAIANNIDNGEYIGVLLVKECGIPAKKACEYKWKEVIFDEAVEYVSLIIQNYELAGAVHNYTRPIPPFAADILTKRYIELQKSYTDIQIQEMYVASNKNNPEKPLIQKF